MNKTDTSPCPGGTGIQVVEAGQKSDAFLKPLFVKCSRMTQGVLETWS